MSAKRFAILGTGFWARYQLSAWRELNGAACVAVYNRTRHKAEALAREFDISAVYDDARTLMARESLDFVDIITDVNTHADLVHAAAEHGIPVICQKPMAATLAQAEAMVGACRAAAVPMFVHENWRWQTPIRALRTMLDAGPIGRVHRATITMVSGFPVFKNQPFLADLDQFVITDIGSHILDTARFLFGEAGSVFCQTHNTLDWVKGENVATIMLRMRAGPTVICNLGYAQNPLERECFPETLIHVEGTLGTLELCPRFKIHLTTQTGTCITQHPPPHHDWANPDYDLVHASAVPCNENILRALCGDVPAETTGEDNLETVRLVFGAYESAALNQVITL